MVDTYTLINGVKQTAIIPGKYVIKYENGGTINTDTVLNELLLDASNNMCFGNPLLFALFNTHQITDFKKTNITNKLNTSSENIVIKVDKFGSGAKTEDVSFGFITTKDASANFIFLHSDLFEDIKTDKYDKHDEIRKYALVLLEKYYNGENNKEDDKEKIKTLCKSKKEVTHDGGNTTKDPIVSSQKKTRKKRKIL